MKPKNSIISSILLLSMVVFTVETHAGRWYEDYSDAVTLMESGKCSVEAIQLLGAALVDHPKARKTARTIAVRTIDYLPYLQLAKAYQRCGADRLSRQYLQLSRMHGAAGEEKILTIASGLNTNSSEASNVDDIGKCKEELALYRSERKKMLGMLENIDKTQTRNDAARRQALETSMTQIEDIYFQPNMVDIEADQVVKIARIAGMLTVVEGVDIEIIGYTDSTGDVDRNQHLSMERARSVLALLVSLGVERDRLSSTGLGATRPLGDNMTSDGRRQNRRVEINIVK